MTTIARAHGLAWLGLGLGLAEIVAVSTGRKRKLGTAATAVLGVAALDLLAARALTGGSRTAGRGRQIVVLGRSRGVEVRRDITVGRPPEEIYRFWRDFENLPDFMEHLVSVRTQGDRRSRWTARPPSGTTVEWDAEIIEDRPNELIAWRSVDDAEVPNIGSVRFTPAPGGQGTEVRVELRYDPPGGRLGAAIAKVLGDDPGRQVDGDLRRLKQVMETGERATSGADR